MSKNIKSKEKDRKKGTGSESSTIFLDQWKRTFHLKKIRPMNFC